MAVYKNVSMKHMDKNSDLIYKDGIKSDFKYAINLDIWAAYNSCYRLLQGIEKAQKENK